MLGAHCGVGDCHSTVAARQGRGAVELREGGCENEAGAF